MPTYPEFSHYIDGRPGRGDGPEQLVIDPSTGETIWSYASDTVASVELALDAAERAFPAWSSAPPADRAAVLSRLAVELESIAEELAQVETAQTGKPIRLSREFDVPGSIDNVAFFAGAARHLDGKAAGEYSPDHTSMIRRQAVGVVGSIAPWNYPLQMAVWKVLPAIAAGNTIVLKPAENTPLTTLLLAQACERAGLPPGVLNVVNGLGHTVGRHLVSSPRIAMTSFTGSTAVGREIGGLASQNGTRLHLELGGKAPFVVFDDAHLDAAVRGAVAASLINSGQDCTAATRAYVQRGVYDQFVSGVADLMTTVRQGDPRDPLTDQGPLVSFKQRDRVAAMVNRATESGARAVTGGRVPGGSLADGAYYLPTLLTDVHQHSEIVQHEVFGPVLTVMPFGHDDEAFSLANDVPFGLAASAWTRDLYRGQRASRLLDAGTVWINDHIPIISEMPHGGMKASGYGKDMSAYSFDEYTDVKHVMLDITDRAMKPWHDTIFTTADSSRADR